MNMKAKRIEVREDRLLEFIETAYVKAEAGCPLDDTSGCRRKTCEGCKYFWDVSNGGHMQEYEIVKWMKGKYR